MTPTIYDLHPKIPKESFKPHILLFLEPPPLVLTGILPFAPHTTVVYTHMLSLQYSLKAYCWFVGLSHWCWWDKVQCRKIQFIDT